MKPPPNPYEIGIYRVTADTGESDFAYWDGEMWLDHSQYPLPAFGFVVVEQYLTRRREKPKIVRVRRRNGAPIWRCTMDEGWDSVQGEGNTPKKAYQSWSFERKHRQRNPTKYIGHGY